MTNNNKRLGTSFEKSIVKQAHDKGIEATLQPLSGQLFDTPGDVEFATFLGECKVRSEQIAATGSKYIRIPVEYVEKINKESKRIGKQFGVVFVKMKNKHNSYAVLQTNDFLDLVKKACLLSSQRGII